MAILNKKEFCDIMNKIIDTENCINEVNNIFRNYNKDVRIDSLLFEYNSLIYVLEVMFNNTDDIDYWIYDLDCGKKYYDGCITEADGTNIVLKTPEDLYEFLIKEMNQNENI